ncbi:hypothetical protein A3K73_02575 [Candidatus Pacearchaeota archaeon RBG_13_36_9]|nr:MAG: hypothetical protein A3K73_02575 [Candidatus Pacearchaeota archaeon RBG_13_36_9]
MKIKAVLCDFDGTLVNKDILDVICGIVNKEQESKKLNEDYHEGKIDGLTALITRINFLHGVSISQISKKLKENDYLISGAEELFKFLKKNKIVTILNSGNILPVLQHYSEKLKITYIVGTKPIMKGNVIDSISEKNFSGANFKLEDSKLILKKLKIKPSEVIALGDSPADKSIFEYSAKSIAINPKGGIEKSADYIPDFSLVFGHHTQFLKYFSLFGFK